MANDRDLPTYSEAGSRAVRGVGQVEEAHSETTDEHGHRHLCIECFGFWAHDDIECGEPIPLSEHWGGPSCQAASCPDHEGVGEVGA